MNMYVLQVKPGFEEAAAADIILNVQDLTVSDIRQQAEVTSKLLSELGCEGIPQVYVMNKADAAEYTDTVFEDDNTVLISAKEKTGFDRLLRCIMKNLPETAFIGKIRQEGRIFSEEYTAEGTEIDALIDVKLIKEAEQYLI